MKKSYELMKSILYQFNNNFYNTKYYCNIAHPLSNCFFWPINEFFFCEQMKSINLIIVFLIQTIIATLIY